MSSKTQRAQMTQTVTVEITRYQKPDGGYYFHWQWKEPVTHTRHYGEARTKRKAKRDAQKDWRDFVKANTQPIPVDTSYYQAKA